MKKDMVDLDALSPETKSVKFKGKVIEITPPTTEQVIELMKLASKVDENDKDNVAENFGNLTEVVKKIVPEIEGELNFSQTIALVELVMGMVLPKDKEELDKQGIKVDIDPKAKAA